MAKFIPQKGDFVSYYFEVGRGHEQHGRRPALVVSNSEFNKLTGIVLMCPITSVDREYPFHIPIPVGTKVSGVVMVDQIQSADYEGRKARFLSKSPAGLAEQVIATIGRIIN